MAEVVRLGNGYFCSCGTKLQRVRVARPKWFCVGCRAVFVVKKAFYWKLPDYSTRYTICKTVN
jgi:hypothetical protein